MSTTARVRTDRFFIDQKATKLYEAAVCQSLLNDHKTTVADKLFLRQPLASCPLITDILQRLVIIAPTVYLGHRRLPQRFAGALPAGL